VFLAQQQIGPYTLIRRLGQGGFGEVWLAEKRGSLLTTQVALKLPLDPDPDLDAVEKEARVWLQASGHPNVLPVLDAEVYNGQVVIVSEYAAGGSLATWLKQNGGKAPSVEAVFTMTGGILAGLEYLHTLTPEPIIHRDLKPDNVLLQGGLPRLTDFGISRVLKTSAQTQSASGTPHYMPPEAFEGRYSPQSDVWAAGVILYQMLSGRLPFPQSDLPALYGAILNGVPKPLSADIPETLRIAVQSALEKDPARRPQSAAALDALLRRPPVGIKPSPVPSNSPVVLPPTIPVPSPGPALIQQSAPPRNEITLWGHEDSVRSVAISADGRRVATGSFDNTARAWDAAAGNNLLTLPRYKHSKWSLLIHVRPVAISADGSRIVTGSSDHTAKVWDAETGRELLTLRGHSGFVSAVAISADGKFILTGSHDNTAKVWDAETGQERLTLTGHRGELHTVAIAADGSRMVTGSDDKTAKVWDAKTGSELLNLSVNGSVAWICLVPVSAVAISADGRYILTGSHGNTAKVWDIETGQELLSLQGHSSFVRCIATSADSRRIVTGSADGTAKVWDAKTGRELLTLTGHSSTVRAVAMSEDGQRIVTGSDDKTAKVWTLPPAVQ
jgi:WD40 repeat protein